MKTSKKYVSLLLAPSIFALAYLRLFRQLMRFRGFHAKEAVIACSKKGQTQWVTVPEFHEPHSKCIHNFKESTAFFHVGKAGGGTVTTELRKYRVGVSSSHPKPSSSKVESLRRGPLTTLIVNVRDPVDRFVSAFRWRLVVLCSPDDKRSRRRRGAAQSPHEMCKTSKTMRKEERMLREKYRSDPNAMAEALCQESPKRTEAIEDYSRILHSMPLAGQDSWLEFLLNPRMHKKISSKGIQNFIVLPMEKQRNSNTTQFEHHIEQVVLHLLQTRYGKGIAGELMERTPQEVKSKTKEKYEHSGAKYHDATNSTIPLSLSPLGECCLARHLEKDYQLIKTMLGYGDGDNAFAAVKPLRNVHPVVRKACSWGDEEQHESCRSDLKSMLSRRARYLDRSLGSCSTIVANMDSKVRA